MQTNVIASPAIGPSIIKMFRFPSPFTYIFENKGGKRDIWDYMCIVTIFLWMDKDSISSKFKKGVNSGNYLQTSLHKQQLAASTALPGFFQCILPVLNGETWENPAIYLSISICLTSSVSWRFWGPPNFLHFDTDIWTNLGLIQKHRTKPKKWTSKRKES